MEVTKTNFKQTLPEIQSAINSSTFLSIDCELTGLKTSLNYVNAFDKPSQLYEKVLKDCKEFLAIQYGLTTFRYDESSDSVKHKSYNFYIFRRPMKKFVQDQRFLCQSSSIDFLTEHNFDFNKLFKEGISYMNNVEEEKCREYLGQEHKKKKDFANKSFDRLPIPEEHEQFVGDVMKSLEAFVGSDDKELQLPKCNGFVRRLIYQTTADNFPKSIQLETRSIERDRVLVATRMKSKDELEEIQQKKLEDVLEEMEDYLGFSKVVKMIVESGKLVIGHNLLLDFLHTIDKFLTPLPEDYLEFKECASSLFTRVLDTKYMASSQPFKEFISSTVLAHVLDAVTAEKFEKVRIEQEENSQGYKIDDIKEHEAGYDSYITGVSFIGMWKYLGNQAKIPNKDIFSISGHSLLNPYMNKIFLMFLADQQFINLAGHDLQPSRDHVFHLTFPKEWTTNNIVQLFSPFGNVYIAWLTETTAYVGLFKKENAAVALKTLSQSDTYSIITYAKRQALLTGQMAIMPSPIKRRKSNDGPSAKRRKTNSLESNSFSKRSIEKIDEESEKSEEESEDSSNKGVNISKLFSEDSSWD